MIPLEVLQGLAERSATKIVLVVIDGLGGIPNPDNGKTELETANIPNLEYPRRAFGLRADRSRRPWYHTRQRRRPPRPFWLRPDSIRHRPRRPLGLWLGFRPAAERRGGRANFATVDDNGNVTDRRAGRIPSEVNSELLDILATDQDSRRRDLPPDGERSPGPRRVPGRGTLRPTDRHRSASSRALDQGRRGARARKRSAPRTWSTRSGVRSCKRSRASTPPTPCCCAGSRSGRPFRPFSNSTSSIRLPSPPTRCTRVWPGWPGMEVLNTGGCHRRGSAGAA